MSRVNLKDIEDAFAAMRLANKHDPKEWKNKLLQQFTTNDGINEFEQLTKLKAIVQNFVEDNDICSEETIYQSDWVIENAYDFIAELVNLSGFKEETDE